MRVVCLVPSWTETLLKAGVEVVGRTRFCVEPRARVEKIPAVGGTKDCDWARIRELKPDLLLLDQEENPKWMSEQAECAWHASHVESVHDMPHELKELGEILQNESLAAMGERWRKVLSSRFEPWKDGDDPPALMEWGQKPNSPIERTLYLIWKDPWMAVGRDTFIGSVLALFGIELSQFESRYPAIDLENFDAKRTLLLLSSEPYPFHKVKSQLRGLNFPHAFVKGDYLSWFGVRTLEFLETNLNKKFSTE